MKQNMVRHAHVLDRQVHVHEQHHLVQAVQNLVRNDLIMGSVASNMPMMIVKR